MQVHSFGCIPFARKRERVLMVLMILHKGGHWGFPKGKPQANETEQATALRELKEETGLSGELIPERAIDTMYTFNRSGTKYDKHVRYFFCRVSDKAAVTVQKSEINDYVWLPLEELVDRATYPQMKEVAQKVVQTLTV